MEIELSEETLETLQFIVERFVCEEEDYTDDANPGCFPKEQIFKFKKAQAELEKAIKEAK